MKKVLIIIFLIIPTFAFAFNIKDLSGNIIGLKFNDYNPQSEDRYREIRFTLLPPPSVGVYLDGYLGNYNFRGGTMVGWFDDNYITISKNEDDFDRIMAYFGSFYEVRQFTDKPDFFGYTIYFYADGRIQMVPTYKGIKLYSKSEDGDFWGTWRIVKAL